LFPPSRRKSAAERREQKHRDDARLRQALLKELVSLSHSGSNIPLIGHAPRSALQSQVQSSGASYGPPPSVAPPRVPSVPSFVAEDDAPDADKTTKPRFRRKIADSISRSRQNKPKYNVNHNGNGDAACAESKLSKEREATRRVLTTHIRHPQRWRAQQKY